MKRLNKKGFTLAELLIVVAIIAVLVAIAIPIFTSQLEKSRDAVTVANLRSAYAEASATKLTGEGAGNVELKNESDGTVTVKVSGVVAKGEKDGFESKMNEELPFTFATGSSDMGKKSNGKDGKYDVTFSWDKDNNVTATAEATKQ